MDTNLGPPYPEPWTTILIDCFSSLLYHHMLIATVLSKKGHSSLYTLTRPV